MTMSKGMLPQSMMGKGMPSSGLMHSKGMMAKGMMGQGMMATGMLPPPPPPQEDKGIVEQIFGANDVYEQPVPVPQVPMMPSMMPIPWQQETEKPRGVEKPHVGFDGLSIEQLQAMAVTRAK